MRLLLHKVPAQHGLQWIRQGWQVFRSAPLPLSALLASYLVGWLLIGLLGSFGAALMLATLPLLSLVYMVATHLVLQKRPVGFAVWAQPFKLTRRRLHAQVQLGLLYVILTVGLMLLAHLLDGGALERLQQVMGDAGRDEAGARAAEAALTAAIADPNFLAGLALRLGGAALLSVPFWHAPALVHWGGHGPLKALFSSCVGIWANRGAFALNALAWFGLFLAASLIINLLAALLQTPGLATLLIFPVVLLCSTVFYCGLYFTFVDCFRFAADETGS